MVSAEVNFHFTLYGREHSMRNSKIYKAFCRVVQILPLDTSKGNERGMRENKGQKGYVNRKE